jgi:hypothetical protein
MTNHSEQRGFAVYETFNGVRFAVTTYIPAVASCAARLDISCRSTGLSWSHCSRRGAHQPAEFVVDVQGWGRGKKRLQLVHQAESGPLNPKDPDEAFEWVVFPAQPTPIWPEFR